eukprot:6204858-Pleurochrysis_carterae.AAC.3
MSRRAHSLWPSAHAHTSAASMKAFGEWRFCERINPPKRPSSPLAAACSSGCASVAAAITRRRAR